MEPVTPSIGWGVLHLYYRVDRDRAERDPEAGKRIVDAVASLEADGHQAVCMAMLGHKADLGVMALGPDLARLQAFQAELLGAPLDPVWSYLSLTELSEYGATEDEERERLVSEEDLVGNELEARLATWRERIEHYREQRIHPKLPAEAGVLLLPDVEAPRGRRELVRAVVRGTQGADERPRACRAHLRRACAAAHHRLDRHRRLGVGRHAASPTMSSR